MTDKPNDTPVSNDRESTTEAETHPAISTTDLTKTYGETTAVDGLDLTVERGAVYGFLGPNGAGKTTTIRMLTALLPPTGGTGRVAGTPITDREALIEHIGYLPESPPIHEEFTAREQLEYHGGLRNMPPTKIDDRIETLLARFELADAADQRIATYSKGMRQKTGLIQAIMHEPSVVFLDEPTSGLDPRAARTVRETITDLAAAGTTVFLSTHILPLVEEIATTVGILYDGDLVADGEPGELANHREIDEGRTLEDVFLEVTTEDEYRADESRSK
ncbi:ABC transporter ATP-binding protein [Halosimplex pelagicum]|uniref:ABC transporter ATP-binding protein n=1 Tax=Halosimplex pelagicum TaxID=869886 RepID=A0A7D5TBC5_9EURY|nr:ABC transporter ATP-binding protein [Halosimplex pelagicum]QLH81175.1 ABC transporter ATP-binding protein [Halosimplex pelagicum]